VRTDPDQPSWVSRGAHKLLGAREAFPVPIEGRRALDAGATTRGFTEVLLSRGAAEVVAADVGYGELAWSLRTDDRVRVHERTNVRTLTPEAIDGPVDLVVADLSFISLRLVLPALTACAREDADILPMVKPQFEVGRERHGAGGVVRDPEHRVQAVLEVGRAAASLGWGTAGVVASPLPGPAGNVEFFLWLRHDAGPPQEDEIRRAVKEGPQ
jgi:23S rRNA (cytidine1920-2'-O)/16S rRNA (cytidine1409-2'-O)-methyltransferase